MIFPKYNGIESLSLNFQLTRQILIAIIIFYVQESCVLEFDGASKGNPGQAGAGAVLRAHDGSVVYILPFGTHINICILINVYLISLSISLSLSP